MSLLADLIDLATAGIGFVPLRLFHDTIDEMVDYPFIDEMFHVRQAQAYCDGDWQFWDPKITTPPGLYWLSVLYDDLVDSACTLNELRTLNLLGGVVLAGLTYYLRRNLHHAGFSTFSIMMNPLLSIYYSLFYTDVWSAVFTIGGYCIATARPFKRDFLNAIVSALLGLVSITFRQTNVVWTAFSMVALLDSIAQDQKLYTGDLNHDVRAIVRLGLNKLRLVVPYILVGALFGLFVYGNGGITLGDKTNHTVTFHAMQLFYCATFVTGFTLPLWFSLRIIRDYIKDNLLSRKGLFLNAIWIPLIGLAIKNFTIIHPFVLADNRHYVFYLVKRFILRTENARYELIPVYHFSCYVVLKFIKQCFSEQSSSNSSLAMFFALICSTVLTLVPSPLLEPRYFIIPFIFFRIMINPSFDPLINIGWLRKYNTAIRLVLEGIWIWMWTQAIYVIFIRYTFPWESEINPQRVIW